MANEMLEEDGLVRIWDWYGSKMKKLMYKDLRLIEIGWYWDWVIMRLVEIESDRKWQIHLEEDDVPGLEGLFPSLAPALHKGKQVGKVQDDLGLKIKILIWYLYWYL